MRTDEQIRQVFRDRLSVGGFNACWEWKGARVNGYGRIYRTRSSCVLTHRLAWELWRGPIPKGAEIDHLCRNHSCANPRHLELVTRRENILRGVSPAARNARKTHCPKGHEYTSENTYVDPSGKRHCRICDRERLRKRRASGNSR